jgi:hypothetical protein
MSSTTGNDDLSDAAYIQRVSIHNIDLQTNFQTLPMQYADSIDDLLMSGFDSKTVTHMHIHMLQYNISIYPGIQLVNGSD